MHERKSYIKLLEESFPGLEANIIRCTALGFSWEMSKLFLKEERGETLSHVALLECPMLIDGRWCQIGALHGICTKGAHRGQGLASQLIQEALQWAKNRYEFIILFTEMPKFYEGLSFQSVEEYRFHLPCQRPKGSQLLRSVSSPKDDELFLRCFQKREALSNHVWINDNGVIASFSTLFATYPIYWSLYYSPIINGFISYTVEAKTLHLLDVIASKMPSLDLILDHLPVAIDDIYFYFSPDRLSDVAVAEPYLYDKGHLMIHGAWPLLKPFMISPLSRC